MFVGPQEQGLPGERGSGEGSAGDLIRAEHHEVPAGLRPPRQPGFAEKQDAAVGGDGRRRVVAFQPFCPVFLPRSGIDALGNPFIRNEVEFVADQQR